MADKPPVIGVQGENRGKVNAANVVQGNMDNSEEHHHGPKYDAKGAQIGAMGDKATTSKAVFGHQGQAKRDLADFSVNEVAEYLTDKGYGDEAELLKKKKVAGRSFVKLTDDKLKKYGIDDEDIRENLLTMTKD